MQVVDPSEDDLAQNLIEVRSIEEGPFDAIDPLAELECLKPAVENHESIIIPALQNKENQEKIPETLENCDQVDLVNCEKCGRTFLPERLEKHQKSCKGDKPLKKRPADGSS